MISIQFTAIVRITCNRNNCSLVRSIFKCHTIELHFWNRNPDYMWSVANQHWIIQSCHDSSM